MKKHSSNRSGILLMELIIAILFFSIVSAICLQLFVKSHNLSKDSKTLTASMNEVTSVAECLQYPDEGIDILKGIYPNLKNLHGNYLVYYDSEFAPSTGTTATYYLQVTPTVIDDATTSYAIAIYETDSTSALYETTITNYKQATL